MKIPKKRFVLTLFVILVGLAAMRLQAQMPFPQPTSGILETVTESNLLQQYPDRSDLSNNVTEIKKYLSSDSPYSMRLSTSTENVMSRVITAQHMRQSDIAYTNVHCHINFSSNQFLVEELQCPPNSYSLDSWESVPNKAKIRSDGFFDGKYFEMMPGGVQSQMEFGTLDAFKLACIAYIKNNPTPTKTQNLLMEQAVVDFRQYARFQNLGHEGVVPNSYVFAGNDFVCADMHGDRISGSIHVNEAGLVDQIHYQASEHYGPQTILLFYDTFFSNCAWYPSRIVNTVKDGDNSYAVRQILTVHNVYADQGSALSIPKTSSGLYGTNITQQIEWSNNMAYEVTKTQLLARPSLTVRALGEDSPRKKKRYFVVLFITSSMILLSLIVYFSSKNK